MGDIGGEEMAGECIVDNSGGVGYGGSGMGVIKVLVYICGLDDFS